MGLSNPKMGAQSFSNWWIGATLADRIARVRRGPVMARSATRMFIQVRGICALALSPSKSIASFSASLLAARPLPQRMTMLVLKDKQRELLSDKLPDAGNLAVGALFFGQFLTERPFSYALAVTSVALWFAAIGFTFWLVAAEE